MEKRYVDILPKFNNWEAIAYASDMNCPNCGEPIKPHRACTKCGFYKGKDVLNKKEEN